LSLSEGEPKHVFLCLSLYMQMSCYSRHRGRSFNSLCPFALHRHALKI